MPDISVLLGCTLVAAEKFDDALLKFTLDDGRVLRQEHWQDCCESVYVESIVGDLTDLVGSPILQAAAISSADCENRDVEKLLFGLTPPEADESYTWTFYNLATIKGSVTIRWFGTSNGYYSESVDCYWDGEDRWS